MSGWSATGLRVVLASEHSNEYRDFYTWVGDQIVSVIKMKRSITLERAIWRGLTKAGADSKTPTAGWTITGRNRVGESGQWEVSEELKTEGEWVVA